MTSEPIPRTQSEIRDNYKIGFIAYNVLQKDSSDRPNPIVSFPGQYMASFLFNYGDMVGNLTVVDGLQKPFEEIQQKINYMTIVSGSGVFRKVKGEIVSQPYVDAEGNQFLQFAAYFD